MQSEQSRREPTSQPLTPDSCVPFEDIPDPVVYLSRTKPMVQRLARARRSTVGTYRWTDGRKGGDEQTIKKRTTEEVAPPTPPPGYFVSRICVHHHHHHHHPIVDILNYYTHSRTRGVHLFSLRSRLGVASWQPERQTGTGGEKGQTSDMVPTGGPSPPLSLNGRERTSCRKEKRRPKKGLVSRMIRTTNWTDRPVKEE